jgi:hypothetical protein
MVVAMRNLRAPDTTLPPSEATHEHAWRTESRHAVSTGWVLYVRCACGARRVDVQDHPRAVPAALSRELGPGATAS